MARKIHRIIWAAKTVKKEGQDEKTFWTRIGATFLNKDKDQSENLYFDFYPTDPETTIQLRFPKVKDSE